MIQDSRARMGPSGAGALVGVTPFGPAVGVDERTIDLAVLIRIFRRRLPLIVITIAGVLSLAMGYILLTTPSYTSAAKVLVDPRKKHTVGTEVVPSGLGENFGESFALVDSQVKVILSDAVLRPVVQAQHLAFDPEFGGPGTTNLLARIWGGVAGLIGGGNSGAESESPEDRALKTLVKQLKVERDDQTFVIEIDVTSIDAVKAARLAQAIAEAYLADQSNDKAETTQRVSALMNGQLATLRQRLSDAENQVEKFRADHNLQEADGELIDTHQLRGLNDQLISAQAEVVQTEAKYEQVQRLLHDGADPGTIADAVGSETIGRLREQYAMAARKEATLSASLLPSHPQMIQAHTEVTRLRDLIHDEVQRIADAIKLQYEVAKRKLASAETALIASRQETDTNDSARVKLRELERDAKTTRGVYESFLSRVKEMNEAELIYTPDARIISPAAIPDKASWPHKSLILALALVFGCGLGSSLALTAEHLDRRIYNGAQMQAATGLKSLASIPSLQARGGFVAGLLGHRRRRASFYDMVLEILEGGTRFGFRPAVLSLLSRLINFDTLGQPRVVLLTSSLPGEGKSGLALSLAVAAASTGMRTLLVDADIADPALTKMIGEPVAGSKLSDRVITDPRLALSFLSLTDLPPTGWSRHNAVADELARMTAGFDLTLVDAGLLRFEHNAAALINASQAILFLARASATSQDAAASGASDLLQMANGKRCAAVLTMSGAELDR